MRAWTQLFEPGPALATLCIFVVFAAQTIAAPTSPDQNDEQSTEIEYYPVADATGCYYNFEHYNEGDRIITNEPCLNCTCHNRMLMCYLKVCPFTKAIGANCKVEKRPDQCCPVITCPEVPVHLVTSTAPSTALGHLNEYGCSIDGLFYSDGARVPSNPENPCELCYCIRNKTACVMQECTLNVEGCRPVFQEGVCCPVRYNCEHPDYLEGPTTPQITTTTTTEAPTTTIQPTYECEFHNRKYNDGELVKKDLPCEKCYCMRGDIVCAVQECGPTPLDKVNCTALPVRDGQCCPDTYDCAGVIEEELTTLSSVSYETEPTTQSSSVKKGSEATEQPLTTAHIEPEIVSQTEGIIITEATSPEQQPEGQKPTEEEEEEGTTVAPEIIEEFTRKPQEAPQPAEHATEAPALEPEKTTEQVTKVGVENETTEKEQVTIVTAITPEGQPPEITEKPSEKPSIEEKITETTESPVEAITSRITEAIESITSRVTEAIEAVATAIGATEQAPSEETTKPSEEHKEHEVPEKEETTEPSEEQKEHEVPEKEETTEPSEEHKEHEVPEKEQTTKPSEEHEEHETQEKEETTKPSEEHEEHEVPEKEETTKPSEEHKEHEIPEKEEPTATEAPVEEATTEVSPETSKPEEAELATETSSAQTITKATSDSIDLAEQGEATTKSTLEEEITAITDKTSKPEEVQTATETLPERPDTKTTAPSTEGIEETSAVTEAVVEASEPSKEEEITTETPVEQPSIKTKAESTEVPEEEEATITFLGEVATKATVASTELPIEEEPTEKVPIEEAIGEVTTSTYELPEHEGATESPIEGFTSKPTATEEGEIVTETPIEKATAATSAESEEPVTKVTAESEAATETFAHEPTMETLEVSKEGETGGTEVPVEQPVTKTAAETSEEVSTEIFIAKVTTESATSEVTEEAEQITETSATEVATETEQPFPTHPADIEEIPEHDDKTGVTPAVSEKEKPDKVVPEKEGPVVITELPEISEKETEAPEQQTEIPETIGELEPSHDETEEHIDEHHEEATETPLEETVVTKVQPISPEQTGTPEVPSKTDISSELEPTEAVQSVTEPAIIPERCDGETCARVPSEKSTTSEPAVQETSQGTEEIGVSSTEKQPITPTKKQPEETETTEIQSEKATEQPSKEPSAFTEATVDERKTEQAENVITTESEEVVIVTEIPTKKTELPESMDHISESAYSTEGPKEPAQPVEIETEKTELTPEITEGPEVSREPEIHATIPGEGKPYFETSSKPQVEEVESTVITEEETSNTTAEGQRVPELTTEIPREEDNEISHEETEPAAPEHEVPLTEAQPTRQSTSAPAESTGFTTSPEGVEDITRPEEHEQITEKEMIPEVCTSETECAPGVIPSVTKPSEFAETTSIKSEEPSEGTTESNKIPEVEEHTEETNEIPEGETETVAKVTETVEGPDHTEESSGALPTELPTKEEEEGSGETPEGSGTTESYPGTSPEVSEETESSPIAQLPTEAVPSQTEVVPEEVSISEPQSTKQTELPEREIPGEGSCLVDGQTYKNNSSVPPLNQCQTACRCVSSILRCETIECSPPPAGLQNCLPIFKGPDSCCPTYNCAGAVLTTEEAEIGTTAENKPIVEETSEEIGAATTLRSLISGEANITESSVKSESPTEKVTEEATEPSKVNITSVEETATKLPEVHVEVPTTPFEQEEQQTETATKTSLPEEASKPEVTEVQPEITTVREQEEITGKPTEPGIEKTELTAQPEAVTQPAPSEEQVTEVLVTEKIEKGERPVTSAPVSEGEETKLPPSEDQTELSLPVTESIAQETEQPEHITESRPVSETEPEATTVEAEVTEQEKKATEQPEDESKTEPAITESHIKETSGAETESAPTQPSAGEETKPPKEIHPELPQKESEEALTTQAPKEEPIEHVTMPTAKPIESDSHVTIQQPTEAEIPEEETTEKLGEPKDTSQQPEEDLVTKKPVEEIPEEETTEKLSEPKATSQHPEEELVTKEPVEELPEEQTTEKLGEPKATSQQPEEELVTKKPIEELPEEQTTEKLGEPKVTSQQPEEELVTKEPVEELPEEQTTGKLGEPKATSQQPEEELVTKKPVEEISTVQVEITEPAITKRPDDKPSVEAVTELPSPTEGEGEKQPSSTEEGGTEKPEKVPQELPTTTEKQEVEVVYPVSGTEQPSEVAPEGTEKEILQITEEPSTEDNEIPGAEPEKEGAVQPSQTSRIPAESEKAGESTEQPEIEKETVLPEMESPELPIRPEEQTTSPIIKEHPTEIGEEEKEEGTTISAVPSEEKEQEAFSERIPEEGTPKPAYEATEMPSVSGEETASTPSFLPAETETSAIAQETESPYVTPEIIRPSEETERPHITSESTVSVEGQTAPEYGGKIITTQPFIEEEEAPVTEEIEKHHEETTTPSIATKGDEETTKPEVEKTTLSEEKEKATGITQRPSSVSEEETEFPEKETAPSGEEAIPTTEAAATEEAVSFPDEEHKKPSTFISPEVTTVPAAEELNTSMPIREEELFTSGPQVEVTTLRSIPGQLSTSAPVSEPTTILPVTTTSTELSSAEPGEHILEPDYGQEEEEEEPPFGPGTCRYGGKAYLSAQQIPRDDPCDFCFCFRSDIICLQQSCPPPIPRCHEEPIRGFCCPRYECPVSMATSVNVTTSTTTTTTTLPPHFLSHAYKGRASKTGCQISGKAYKVGEVIRATSGPCLHCTCGGDGQMKCDPKPCSPEPMLRQMIAAAALRRR